MNSSPRKLSLEQWDLRHRELTAVGLVESWYGGLLSRHVLLEGDQRLRHLQFDDSPAALRLWNFLLTENQRLRRARNEGCVLIGAMKDLGTVPVMAFSFPRMRAFYPDGAWWTPCLMECSDGLLQRAEVLGIDAAFCPVRAMLSAFESEEHFPRPDLLICSTGAVCDDFSAIAQRLQHRGACIHWWEMPRRRRSDVGEPSCPLTGGLNAPRIQVDLVKEELGRVFELLAQAAGQVADTNLLHEGIRKVNRVRCLLQDLRKSVYLADAPPLPGLEMLVSEMLAIHFCSDLDECIRVLSELLDLARSRIERKQSVLPDSAVRVFWVNPVADLRAISRLEEWGARLCGTDYMFTHALNTIPEDVGPLEALARVALADPMVGPAQDRAESVLRECQEARAEAVIVSRIPGASHCAYEGATIRDLVTRELGLPAIELEIPSLTDAMLPTIATRAQALIEIAKLRRARGSGGPIY